MTNRWTIRGRRLRYSVADPDEPYWYYRTADGFSVRPSFAFDYVTRLADGAVSLVVTIGRFQFSVQVKEGQ